MNKERAKLARPSIVMKGKDTKIWIDEDGALNVESVDIDGVCVYAFDDDGTLIAGVEPA